MNEWPDAFSPPPAAAVPEWLNDPCEVVGRLLNALQERELPMSERNGLVTRLASIVLEQHHAIMVMLRMTLNSAALSMARSITETFLKTKWALSHASNQQVQQLCEGSQEFPNLTQLIADVSTADAVEGAFWVQWKRDNYRILCDYAHTGPIQVSHWMNGPYIQPAHPVEELQTLARHAAMLALLAAVCIADAADDANLLAQVTEHFEWFTGQLPDVAPESPA